MPESLIAVAPDSTGKNLRTRQRVVGANTIQEQFVITQPEKIVTFYGVSPTFRIPGRAPAANANQPVFSIWNGSANFVDIQRIMLDAYSTATRLMTVAPPIARVYRITAAPTTGQVQTKTALSNTSVASDAGVVVRGDASADGTGATALAVTLGGMLTQEVMPRVCSHAATTTTNVTPWMEPADRIEFFAGEPDVTLRAGEGMALVLNSPTAAAIPITDFFVANVAWTEYTLP